MSGYFPATGLESSNIVDISLTLKHYNVAISHAAKKLMRLIYAMEKSGQIYQKAKHLTVLSNILRKILF